MEYKFETTEFLHYNLEKIEINFGWQSLWLLAFNSFVIHVPRSTNMLHTTFEIVFDKLIKVCQIQNAFKLWKMQILLASYYKITFCIMQNKRFLQHLLIFSFHIKNFFCIYYSLHFWTKVNILDRSLFMRKWRSNIM